MSCTPTAVPELDNTKAETFPNNYGTPTATKASILASQNITAEQGSSINLPVKFISTPLPEDYAVFIHFVNSQGVQQSFNGDYIPAPGTTTWDGSIDTIKNLVIPENLAPDTYSIRMGLYQQQSPWGRVSLSPGAGVSEDGEQRYIVGSLTITAKTTTANPIATLIGPKSQDPNLYTLTFNEEFNGTSLNSAQWNDTVWYETSNPTKNYKVSNGSLKIWPQRDATGKFFNRTVDTDGKYYQTYGYFEIEAKLPKGKGTWPAFWLFNHIGDKRPEIDIMEAYAGGGPNSGWSDADLNPTAFAATVWPNGASNPKAGHKTLQTPDLSKGFHTYGVLWEPHKQTFYFDGNPFYELEISMSAPMYIMLDLWFGSASGEPDHTTPVGEVNSFEVNYVRAWKKK